MPRGRGPVLRVYTDKASLDRAAASFIAEFLSQAYAARRAPVSLALPGGLTPQSLYALLAAPEFSTRVPWPEVEVFWTDERCVPPDHPDSNYGMVRHLLLSKVPLAEANIHRIQGDLGAAAAARDYDAQLRRLGRGCDVALLGVGEDGHTASLFPGTAALEERNIWATSSETPKGPRVTMTFPYLNLSENILVLASGAAKSKVVAAAASGAAELYPVQRLRARTPALWLVDQDAGAGL
ncbi:MAG: 6-phosphogluconolactonase [Elusimicrobiota bacterium]